MGCEACPSVTFSQVFLRFLRHRIAHSVPGSQETLHALSNWCDLVVVTSRQHVIREPTLEWLGQHFPDLFQSVHFGNHFAMNGESKKKSDICRYGNVQGWIGKY